MKLALMSGAYKNAGDFLIEHRSKKLLEKVYPEAHIDVMKRDISYDDQIDKLNTYDAIVFGGGPGFQKNIYPDKIPFVSDLSEIKVPCAVIGWGWKSKDIKNSSVYNKNIFTKSMKNFIDFLDKDENSISCRDWYTKQMLNNYGYMDSVMTGCPAWYDTDRVEKLAYKGCTLNREAAYIIVSDAAFGRNTKYTLMLIGKIREMFPKARIKLLFHRGINGDNEILTRKENLTKYNYEYEDISGSLDGFAQYDECDLHIGFRVHAHIYNLSHGNTSLLINEDARGFGVNDALGLPNILIDRFIGGSIENQINIIMQSEGICFNNSSNAIKNQYNQMIDYIRGIL